MVFLVKCNWERVGLSFCHVHYQCLIIHNEVEMSSHFWVLTAVLFLFSAVDIGNGSVCWDGERFSLVFFDINAEFSVGVCVWKGNSLTFVILSN